MSATSVSYRSGKSGKPSTSAKQAADATSSIPVVPFFPFARYTSIVGVHTSLLAFTGLFLPRTSLSSLLRASSSGDNDQGSNDVLTALTANPLRTVAWICTGSLVLQIWWAIWLRSWSLDTRAVVKGGADEAAQRAEQKLLREHSKNSRISVGGLDTLGQ